MAVRGGEDPMAKKDKEHKLSKKQRQRRLAELIDPFRVTSGKSFRLRDYDSGSTPGIKDKDEAQEYLKRGVELLATMQDKLYAQDQWGVLLVFQAMDAAGKDGAIKHVMSGVNPQGCQVYSFKSPTSEELDHDFLWRTSKSLPERGRIGIFNRSYYEETLVVRVHPEILSKQKLPSSLITRRIWDERYEDIRSFERYLARQGYVVVKFFLNVSRKEQKRRFLERLERSEKNWKFSLADAQERKYWKDYMAAYQDVIRATATKHAPWYVVPADTKWFARLVVAGAIVDAIGRLGLRYPEVGPDKRKELAAARTELMREGSTKASAKKAVASVRRPKAARRSRKAARRSRKAVVREEPAAAAPPAPEPAAEV
jgi:PPK2 family polyphosphate:nucleotide phosphotransferase